MGMETFNSTPIPPVENEEEKDESRELLQRDVEKALQEGDIAEGTKILEEVAAKNTELDISGAVSKSLAYCLGSFGVKLEKVSAIIDFAKSHNIFPDVASLMQTELLKRSNSPVHNLENLLDVAEENGVELDLSVLSESVPKVLESLLNYDQVDVDAIIDQVKFCKEHNIPLDLAPVLAHAREQSIKVRDNPDGYASHLSSEDLKKVHNSRILALNEIEGRLGIS